MSKNKKKSRRKTWKDALSIFGVTCFMLLVFGFGATSCDKRRQRKFIRHVETKTDYNCVLNKFQSLKDGKVLAEVGCRIPDNMYDIQEIRMVIKPDNSYKSEDKETILGYEFYCTEGFYCQF